ncbi:MULTISPECIES: lamin tail domain-containing protein [unclassified Streptomyces]|uniref:lamin tail domain-containing protein n=1 Tax=unclassified Streptomyces TaxID=2593676 RepID=UPI002E0D6CB8|nr:MULTISPECIES: lamin tail domain-containing protein [unclassified Streptomyces]WSR24189.1 lamin tail domain-containing protein [Streptomyces sp. NBC_01205]
MSASLATRRVVSAFLAAGALVGAAALPAAADGHQRGHRAPQSSIVIGEVQYDSPGRNDRSARALNGEWVEVRNTGRHGVNLRGYTLTDRQGNRYRFNDFRLDGRSSVKVHTGKGRDTSRDVYQDRRDQVWDERDSATLRDNRGNVLDSNSWDGRRHHRNH